MTHIPVPRVVTVIAGRIRRARPSGHGPRLTRPGWFLAALAAVTVAGAVTRAVELADVARTSAPPAWAAALGLGVTVTGPVQVTPGHGSPGAALTGYLAALSANDPATACTYLGSSPAAACSEPSGQSARNRLPYGVSFKTGYVAVDGTRALVGFTGKICSPGATPLPGATPACIANANPAAIFSARNTFAALWRQATSQDSTGTSAYMLLPCVKSGGKWYVGSGST